MAAPSCSQALWPRVSVVIPTLNEARNLPHVLGLLPSNIYELIIVDGHSVDDTLAVARQLRPDARIVMQARTGKGNALACGCAAATGDIIAMLDADGSTDASEIPRFVSALLDGADFAKGTRFAKGGGSEDITRLRAIGNRMLTGMVNLLYGTKYTDLCYGFNGFWQSHRSVLGFDATAMLSVDGCGCSWGDGFEIETLINIRIAAAGLAVAEVPSFERSRIYGASNLCAFSDGMRVLRTILYERFIVPRQRQRFSGRRLLTRMRGAPSHRQVAIAGRSWAASHSSAGLDEDGLRRTVRHPASGPGRRARARRPGRKAYLMIHHAERLRAVVLPANAGLQMHEVPRSERQRLKGMNKSRARKEGRRIATIIGRAKFSGAAAATTPVAGMPAPSLVAVQVTEGRLEHG